VTPAARESGQERRRTAVDASLPRLPCDGGRAARLRVAPAAFQRLKTTLRQRRRQGRGRRLADTVQDLSLVRRGWMPYCRLARPVVGEVRTGNGLRRLDVPFPHPEQAPACLRAGGSSSHPESGRTGPVTAASGILVAVVLAEWSVPASSLVPVRASWVEPVNQDQSRNELERLRIPTRATCLMPPAVVTPSAPAREGAGWA